MIVHGIHERTLEPIKLLTLLTVSRGPGNRQACARPVLKLSRVYTSV